MVSKEELESILAKYYVIDPPKHAFMLDKRTVGITNHHLSFFKGLQPKWRHDVIILTPDGDDESVIHECFHANFGTEELVTNRLGKLLVKKHRLQEMFPNFPKILPSRSVHYELCPGCPLCADLAKLLIHKPPGGEPKHYILKA